MLGREREYLRASWPVAALFVDGLGPYPHLVGSRWYDREADACTYAGPWPVVAHPPCGPWGKLAWNCHAQERGHGLVGVAMVRRWGGVLEHPVGSRLFAECEIPTTPWTEERPTDPWGGYTIRVPQWDWGHRGEKDTILYVVGTEDLPPLPQRRGGAPKPVQDMGHLERRLTPPALAWWLCAVAARCRSPYAEEAP